MHSIDLTAPDIEIKPLHSSILGQDHCFQVSTTNGSKYISCRTAEEREKWIESLRKTVHPHQEQTRRTENSLKLWIIEAKNVSSKKRYFCEILLDKTLYARTSSKTKADMLFWGEHFEFNNLPAVETITVNLYREADKKKKKDRNILLGYVNISVSDISTRQFMEKWFTTASGLVGKTGKENKNELPIIRLKTRYQTVQILPMDLYQDLVHYLTTDYCHLCEALEPLVSIRDKEDIATTMIHIMQKLNKAKEFLSDVVTAEISRLDNDHLTFRGNSIATKAMEAYMKLVGEKYLQDTLGDFVKTIIESDDDCEVDPTKVPTSAGLQRHQTNLTMYCEMAWVKIINSYCYFPSELKDVFASFRTRCREQNKEDIGDNLISGSIFLRFLCPAIMSPSLFSLTQEYPPERASRNLTLIAKTIQTLANFTKFGGKEEFMLFMNEFVEREWSHMNQFLQQISSSGSGRQFLEFDGYIDLGKELSILHSLLSESLERASESTLAKFGRLQEILNDITEARKNPQVGRWRPQNRKSQIYDNLQNVHPQNETSPTEVLREMLRNCGDSSPEEVPKFSTSTRKPAKKGSFDVGSSRHAASSLSTNDDYVTFKALASEVQVADVSVSSRTVSSQQHLNQSWSQIVSAAEVINGDYIDLISFMDEDLQNSSMELEHNINGSQMSISQISTIASSGYQSFGYSQSSSPVDSSAQQELNGDFSKSPVAQLQPLSFSNPVYKHNYVSSRGVTPSPILQHSSSSSLSSNDEANTVKHRSPVKSERSYHGDDPLRRLAPQLSSSSSSESLHEQEQAPRYKRSYSNPNGDTNGNEPVKFSLELKHSSPLPGYSETSHRSSCHVTHYNTIGNVPLRPHELSQSMDFTQLRQRYGGDQLRRTATDSVISNRSTPLHVHTDSGVSVSSRVSGGQMSPEDSPGYRRLSPNNSVHMGIRSVQRKIQEQEKTKQEYETEVAVLKQQLQEAQSRLQQAECRLQDHESGTHQIISDWQLRLEESEERMRKQQAEKDDQMKHIIQRLINVEKELRNEQEEMQKIVHQKQKVIEAQENRIHTLDSANSKLVAALNQLKERQNISSQPRNGMVGPIRTKLADLGEFKTSSC